MTAIIKTETAELCLGVLLNLKNDWERTAAYIESHAEHEIDQKDAADARDRARRIGIACDDLKSALKGGA